MPGKRKDYLSWEEYYMGIALVSSMRSKDPNNQVGACIVNEETHKILSIGYNGLPRGMNDDLFDWASSGEKSGDPMNIKDPYVIHAEINAILNYAGQMSDLEGSTMYVTWSPCAPCAGKIVQAGIKKVIYLREYSDDIQKAIARRMFADAEVKCEEYNCYRKIEKEEVGTNTKAVQKILKGFSQR